MKGIGGSNMTERQFTLRTQLLYYKSSLVSALFSMAFGHRGIQTSPARLLAMGISLRNNLYE
jgi:hypothetical protein